MTCRGAQIDFATPDLDRAVAVGVLPAPDRKDALGQLPDVEGRHDVVVGTAPQRIDAVELGGRCAHHDHMRGGPCFAERVDDIQPRAVGLDQVQDRHQVGAGPDGSDCRSDGLHHGHLHATVLELVPDARLRANDQCGHRSAPPVRSGRSNSACSTTGDSAIRPPSGTMGVHGKGPLAVERPLTVTTTSANSTRPLDPRVVLVFSARWLYGRLQLLQTSVAPSSPASRGDRMRSDPDRECSSDVSEPGDCHALSVSDRRRRLLLAVALRRRRRRLAIRGRRRSAVGSPR